MNNSGEHRRNENELLEILKKQNIQNTNAMLRLTTISNFQNTKVAQIQSKGKENFFYYDSNSNASNPTTLIEKNQPSQDSVIDKQITEPGTIQNINFICHLEDIDIFDDPSTGNQKECSSTEEHNSFESKSDNNENPEYPNDINNEEEDHVTELGGKKNLFRIEEKKSNKYPDCIKFLSESKLTVSCTVCNKKFRNRSDKIFKHLKSIKHKEQLNNVKDETFDPELAAAEIKFAAACAHYNMSFSLTEKVGEVVKDTITDSKLSKKMNVNRKRVRDILVKVIAPAHKRRLTEILSNQKFSVLVDESRDKSGTSYLCINVRYKDAKQKKIVDSLWDIVPVYDEEIKKANADALFDRIVSTFEEAEVELNNIISFSSDGASVMVAHDNSVYARLKARLPNLIRARCNCHLSSLCTKDATKLFPKTVHKLGSVIHSYISSSAQRENNWTDLQKRLNLAPLEMLQTHPVRWLSFYESTLRISRRWVALIFFFEVECLVNKKRKKKKKTIVHLKF